MKKLFLLLAAGSAISANAQVSSPVKATRSAMEVPTYSGIKKHAGVPTAHKPTASHSYWFSFVDVNQTSSSASSLYPIYNDSTLYVPGGTPSPFFWYLHGLGVSFDPTSTTFTPPLTNTTITVLPDFAVTNTNAYSIDSIQIAGRYIRKPYNTGIDTLNIYIALAGGVSGPTGTAIFSGKDVYYFNNLGIPDSTIRFADMVYDSVTNSIKTSSVPSVMKKTIILDDAAFADTISNGLHVWDIALPSVLNATAGQKVVVYQQYITGNPYGFGANIDSANMWEVLTYELNGDNTYPSQKLKDLNAGLITTSLSRYDIGGDALISGGKQYMNSTYFYGAGAGFDDPYMSFHVTCPTCALLSVPAVFGNVGDVKAYPNPAANELSVEYKLNNKADAVVSIQNILGEVVAVQTVKNAKDGKVVFNTSALPSGMYMFGVSANGQRSTGRVSIAH